LSGGFSLPQESHCQGSAAPQSPQNLLLAATAAPQCGHIIRPPPDFAPCTLVLFSAAQWKGHGAQYFERLMTLYQNYRRATDQPIRTKNGLFSPSDLSASSTDYGKLWCSGPAG
jgi:hypothetical protein